MPQFNFGGPPKSKMSHFQIAKLDIQALDPKLEPYVAYVRVRISNFVRDYVFGSSLSNKAFNF